MTESSTPQVVPVIRSGKLPTRKPDRMWGGMGTGAECTLCGERVKGSEWELEVEFGRTDDDAGSEVHHVHLDCFTAWESEVKELTESNGHTVASSVALSANREDVRMVARERSEVSPPRLRLEE